MPSLVVFFILLLSCSAFFSASETALFSLSEVDIHAFKKSRNRSAMKLVACLRRPRELLVSILLGNEFINVSMSIVGAAVINRVAALEIHEQTLLAVAVITPVIFTCGDALPKNVAMKFAKQMAPVIVWPLSVFSKLVRPLQFVLTKLADRMVVLFGGSREPSPRMIMEEEFLRLVELGRRGGAVIEEEQELIHNVFEFTDKVAGSIMTPADKVYLLSAGLPRDEMLEKIGLVQFSRIPFYEGKRSNIIGILHIKDIFGLHSKKPEGGTLDVRTVLRPPLFVEKSLPLEALLKEFRRTQMHMAVVMDGGVFKGVVTMDDVLEELFGQNS